MSLLSHFPKLELRQHVLQVKQAADFLMKFHYPQTISSEEKELLEKIICLHDVGKGTEFFQEYIKDPERFQGVHELKSHAVLSALISGLILPGKSWKDIFLTLQVTAGHHTHLRTLKELIGLWNSDNNNRNFKKQLAHFPAHEVSETLGIDFDINSLDMSFPSEKILDFLEYKAEDCIKNQKLDEALFFRFKVQFLYSILLESDKAFLAVPDVSKHQIFLRHEWKVEWIDRRIGTPVDNMVNRLRKRIRQEVIVNSNSISNLYSLTSPTGSGKTFLSATWAFLQKKIAIENDGINPKIIVVLPFLSIINQTIEEYEKILKVGENQFDGSWMLASHSLSDHDYNSSLEKNEENFFIDTWRSDVIITTYDRFLYAVMDPRSKHQLRFHNLFDSIIILDEVQSLPASLWVPLDKILNTILSFSKTKVLLMSATLPAFVKNTRQLLPAYHTYFSELNRYRLNLEDVRSNKIQDLDSFIDLLIYEVLGWIESQERVLVTLNTRRSAQRIYEKISNFLKANNRYYPMFFISSDVIPLDRIERVKEIKLGAPCIVISTQSIEAGVDIDMTRVYRDFAPLDSLIQIAGRCNRNGKKSNPCEVKIVQLKSQNGRLFSEMIYNQIHLEKTRQILKQFSSLDEKEILSATEAYFNLLMGKEGVDTGTELLRQFSYWEEYENIRTILRGENMDSFNLCLLERDTQLFEIIKEIQRIQDRWERRIAWQSISARLAQITINVIAHKKLNISKIAEDYYGILMLNPAYYDKDVGFKMPADNDNTYIL